jgi:hypothetical protein
LVNGNLAYGQGPLWALTLKNRGAYKRWAVPKALTQYRSTVDAEKRTHDA